MEIMNYLQTKKSTALVVDLKGHIQMISELDALNKRVFLNESEEIKVAPGQILKFRRFKVTRNGNIFVYGVELAQDTHLRKDRKIREEKNAEQSTRVDIGQFLCDKKHRLIDAGIYPGSHVWHEAIRLQTSIYNAIHGTSEEPTKDIMSIWLQHWKDRWERK